LKVKIKIFSF